MPYGNFARAVRYGTLPACFFLPRHLPQVAPLPAVTLWVTALRSDAALPRSGFLLIAKRPFRQLYPIGVFENS